MRTTSYPAQKDRVGWRVACSGVARVSQWYCQTSRFGHLVRSDIARMPARPEAQDKTLSLLRPSIRSTEDRRYEACPACVTKRNPSCAPGNTAGDFKKRRSRRKDRLKFFPPLLWPQYGEHSLGHEAFTAVARYLSQIYISMVCASLESKPDTATHGFLFLIQQMSRDRLSSKLFVYPFINPKGL